MFAEALRGAGVQSLAVFGDSITVGLNASAPQKAWPLQLADATNVEVVRNRAVSGTILQGGMMADGLHRPDNGIGRYREALLGPDRADALAILYGYNDARYVGAPESLNAERFRRDYALMLDGLLEGGFEPNLIAIGSPPFPSDRGFAIGSPGFAGQTRAGFELYVEIVMALASEFSVHYAPVYEAMSRYPDGALSSDDVTHPNDEGHWVIAGAFVSAAVPSAGAAYRNWSTRQG
ncbi:MAG: Lysophospholipase L1-like esterase [Devosia sp.]|uniref:SGNH/GDSL hydrolase family protein n=1 Tax=Devosia sp. TaxID=1871048 RepID=UPI0026097F56|nr:GDSL-type esterase/lipase family protein [Devosia sp.]MDB5585667.1 Lysophospholipase L1-like esterase [Devosia sp.]